MSNLAAATANIEPFTEWRLYSKDNHKALLEGDAVTLNGRGGYNICAIDSRNRRVLVLGDGTNDNPRTVTADSIKAVWRELPAR